MHNTDTRIAHTPYHSLTHAERDTYNGRKDLLAHLGKRFREQMQQAAKTPRELRRTWGPGKSRCFECLKILKLILFVFFIKLFDIVEYIVHTQLLVKIVKHHQDLNMLESLLNGVTRVAGLLV